MEELQKMNDEELLDNLKELLLQEEQLKDILFDYADEIEQNLYCSISYNAVKNLQRVKEEIIQNEILLEERGLTETSFREPPHHKSTTKVKM